MINKKSKNYQEGFNAGVIFTCKHIIDTTRTFRQDMLTLNKILKDYKKQVKK